MAQGAGLSTNVRIFNAIIDRGFNQGDLSVADEVCAVKLSEHEYLAKTDVPGPEILKDQIQTARSNTRGFILTVEDLVENGDQVWARSRCTGTDLRSGKPINITVIDICRFENGKLVEHWGVPDRFARLHQTGVLSPPPKQ
jgi:ketosteroid isomerase-like protein